MAYTPPSTASQVQTSSGQTYWQTSPGVFVDTNGISVPYPFQNSTPPGNPLLAAISRDLQILNIQTYQIGSGQNISSQDEPVTLRNDPNTTI